MKLIKIQEERTHSSCSAKHAKTGAYKKHYTRARNLSGGIIQTDSGRKSTSGYYIEAAAKATRLDAFSQSRGYWGWGA